MEAWRNATVPCTMLGRSGGGTERIDITIDDGSIASIEPHVGGPGSDLDGGLVLPAFVDVHTHLDKGHIWPRQAKSDGTWETALEQGLADAGALWSVDDLERRIEFSLRCAYAHGTAAIRTHVESAPLQYEAAWDLFERVRERWLGRVELQAVAMLGPNDLIDATRLDAVARRVKAAGGSLGGAVRAFARAGDAVRAVVDTAGSYGLDIDLHADEILDPTSTALLHLAEAVLETGYRGRVVAGHCCSLAVQDEDMQRRTIDKVAEAGIAIVALPMCNLYLQDRDPAGRRTPMRRGATLVHEFRAAGVPVAIASDNTRDPFHAYGDLDALEVLREGARVLHFDHPLEEAWSWARTVSIDAAAIAGFDYTAEIKVGAPADLVLFRARNWTELLSRPQSDRIVLRKGVAIDTTLPDYRELDDLMEA